MDSQNAICRGKDSYASVMGTWIDELGNKTSAGGWQVFGTITYATKNYPWQRKFPIRGTGRPNPEFAHNLFKRLVDHLESDLSAPLEYVVADQYGDQNGRFHQHCILSAKGLEKYSRTAIWKWLKVRAGWSRILPFEKGAAFYISRYIGRDANKSEWSFNIGEMKSPLCVTKPKVGNVVIVHSASLGKEEFHKSRKDRKR